MKGATGRLAIAPTSSLEEDRIRFVKMTMTMTTPTIISNTTTTATTTRNNNNNNTREELLRNIERSIARFSDGNLSFVDGKATVVRPSSSQSTTASNSGGEQSIIRKYSPPGLEDAFHRLYSILFPSLSTAATDATRTAMTTAVGSFGPSTSSASSAAILMGPKGSGKSLILERCLEACKEQQRLHKTTFFRQVNINGIVCRGQDVGTVVYEIVRQLNEIAYYNDDGSNDSPLGNGDENHALTTTPSKGDGIEGHQGDDNDENNDEDEGLEEYKRRKRQRRDKHLLRLRKSSFTNNLALLESTLAVADADGVPILIVLDELDSFAEEGERQMLLYHFLDRVATPGSNLILVGITSSFSTLTLLEKRIRSRAEGTAKVIYLRPPESYEDLVQIIRHKLSDCYIRKDIIDCITSTYTTTTTAKTNIDDNTETASSDEKQKNEVPAQQQQQQQAQCRQRQTTIATLQREFALGKDLRWFSRVISTALSLYHYDVSIAEISNTSCDGRRDDGGNSSSAENDTVTTLTSTVLPFDAKQHLVPALVMMGASITDDSTVATKQPDICVVNGTAVDARIQALLDMSKPQVALMLSAKRILTRESHRGGVDGKVVPVPLRLERILKEYQSSFRRGSISNSSGRSSNTNLLMKAASGLLDRGLLVPSMDHSGGGPLQYSIGKVYTDLDPHSLLQMPLHIPFDIERELGTALELNLLDCSTALREWGKGVK